MRAKLNIGGEVMQVTVAAGQDGAAKITVGEKEIAVSNYVSENGELRFSLGGRDYKFHVLNDGGSVQVTDGREYYGFNKVEPGAEAADSGGGADELTSQMPGTVLKLLVEPGAEVKKGQALLILEAMKMEHEICAPSNGTVTGFPHAEGSRVMPGDLLVEFTEAE